MKSLAEFHLKNNAVMGVYNNRTLPSSYHDAMTEYKAVRENALLVDYSHLSIVSVMGDDAWALINQLFPQMSPSFVMSRQSTHWC